MKTSNSSRSKSKQNDVNIKSKFIQSISLSTATAVTQLGLISPSLGTGILAPALNLAHFTDMFRLFRINSICFEFQPQTGVTTANVQIPAGVLAFVPFGTATAPTAIGDFESPLMSEPTVSWGTAPTTAPLHRECGAKLTLHNSDMPVLQGPGGGWLATQDDGTQGNYGKLYWAFAGITAANTSSYLLTTHFDISFKDLLDPALISNLMSMHPTGLPAHISPLPGSPLDSANYYQVRKFQSSACPDPSAFQFRSPGTLKKTCSLTSTLLLLSEKDLESVAALVSRLAPTAPVDTSIS